MARLEADDSNVYSAIFRVAGLTAQRLGEVAGMRWADVDLARAEWRQPTNKSDRPHVVPCRRGRSRSSRRGRGGEACRMCSQPRPAVGSIAGAATSTVRRPATAPQCRCTGWAPHDLRRTAATILAEAKVPPVVIEQLLNHSRRGG